MTPKMRWVSPPNWPHLPEGFEPPDGWKPDPEWPAPPTGWQFWQREDLDVNSGLPWWRRLNRTWAGSVVTIAFLAVLLILLIGVPWHHHSTGHFDVNQLDGQINQGLHKRGVGTALVSCPSNEPIKAGARFICDLAGAAPFRHVEVDVLNSDGQFTYQAIQ